MKKEPWGPQGAGGGGLDVRGVGNPSQKHTSQSRRPLCDVQLNKNKNSDPGRGEPRRPTTMVKLRAQIKITDNELSEEGVLHKPRQSQHP